MGVTSLVRDKLIHFEPSLVALSLRSDVISSIKILYPSCRTMPRSKRERERERASQRERARERASEREKARERERESEREREKASERASERARERDRGREVGRRRSLKREGANPSPLAHAVRLPSEEGTT